VRQQARALALPVAILDRLAGAGASVVGFDYVYRGQTAEDKEFKAVLDRYKDRVVVGSQLDDSKVTLQISPQLNPPETTLIQSGDDPRVGFVNIFPDDDQVVRRFQFRINLLELAKLPFQVAGTTTADVENSRRMVPNSRSTNGCDRRIRHGFIPSIS
jgi:CHASE2 domain-containing sensor protein